MTCGASGTGNIPTTPQSVRAWGGAESARRQPHAQFRPLGDGLSGVSDMIAVSDTVDGYAEILVLHGADRFRTDGQNQGVGIQRKHSVSMRYFHLA